jgi:starch phosphorylase
MAHLAVVGSHSTNGVAAIHSDLLRTRVLTDFAEIFPDRFNNKTNGVTPRRWLQQANPSLTGLITQILGTDWILDLSKLRGLLPLADDAGFRERFGAAKRESKVASANWLQSTHGQSVDPDSIFDSQIKRIHEYKRQLLNLLYVVARYQRIHRDPRGVVARTVIFAGKAAAGYFMAKAIVKLINNVARTINAEPEMRGLLRVVFLPDYDVSLAQKIMPAADLSQQISTAGMEASGTGNMKLALNGAVTIGTLDGANIEIRDHVGEENIFIFGLTAEQAAATRAAGYRPALELERNRELREALELIDSGHFSPARPDDAKPVVRRLLEDGEPFLVLADFAAYAAAQERADALYERPEDWSRKAALNCLNMGYFSSDRSVREYADRIWDVRPVL